MNKSEAKKMTEELSIHLMDRIKKDKSLMMGMYVISGDKTRIVDGFNPNVDEQKDFAGEIVRFLAQKYRADSVVFFRRDLLGRFGRRQRRGHAGSL